MTFTPPERGRICAAMSAYSSSVPAGIFQPRKWCLEFRLDRDRIRGKKARHQNRGDQRLACRRDHRLLSADGVLLSRPPTETQ
jgi:hypothetical protein